MTARSTELFVYHATPGGIAAACTAARMGVKTVLLEPTGLVGGLSTNGIGTAESEHMLDPSFSGIPLEFYWRLADVYDLDVPALYWHPKDALLVFEAMLDEAGVTVLRSGDLDAVETDGGRIRSVTVAGERIEAGMFIDASYEGDLMARAGVDYTFGREGRAEYGESLAGMGYIDRADDAAPGMPGGSDRHADETFEASPYDDQGRLLPFFIPAEEVRVGEGDSKVMCYNFRLTATTNPAFRVPFPKPAGYDPERFIILRRFLRRYPETTLRGIIAFMTHPTGQFKLRENSKWRKHSLRGDTWELNNRQAAIISLGHFGGQFDWPDGSPQRRKEIWDDHVNYTQGLIHFLQHEPEVPSAIRQELAQFGLDNRLYADHGHWPKRLYVREARRMRGQFTMTQGDIVENRTKPDRITIGSHWIDCHHVQRVAVDRNHFRNEGRMWRETTEPFDIPYSCITPRVEQCSNLLVPVPVSASHVAFTAIRLEATWMSLGQAAGAAAALALHAGRAVQEIDIASLQSELSRQGVILDADRWKLQAPNALRWWTREK
ncbi:MAG: FAD-dependent oxidoreductase [Phycisphaeraceae bacterium]|nr:FAD-dependent oxidoreductase [Phycisphaeraceae bacterium]